MPLKTAFSVRAVGSAATGTSWTPSNSNRQFSCSPRSVQIWPERTRNLWGTQIWFDLLLAASVALSLLIPKARALGINPLPWAILSVATSSIGLLAFLALVLWTQRRAGSPPRPAS